MSEEFLPDIDEYLESINDNHPIKVNNLDHLLLKIKSYTGLEKDIVEIIVRTFFQEMRNQALKGNMINIARFGKFFVSSPKRGNKKKIFIKFKPLKHLVDKLNDRF